jgi:cytochrome c-type biogenesis protein CcmH
VSARTATRRGPGWLPWLAMAVVVIAAFAIGTLYQPRLSNTEREFRLAETIRCPSCSGQSAATSDSPSSAAIRTIIRDRVNDGQSDEEITDFVVAQYPGTRLDPSGSGFSALVWALPVGLVVIALAGLWFRFRDWRPGTLAVTDADRTLVADAIAAQPGATAAPPTSDTGENDRAEEPTEVAATEVGS